MSDLASRAATFREEFDRRFAAPPEADRVATEDFLVIRVAGDPFALRVAELVRIARAPSIVAVPTQRSTVIGVAAIRGLVVSVHSLAALLGHAATESCRWIVLVRGAENIGLAFAELDRFVRVPHGRERVLVHEGVSHLIVDVGAIITSIKAGRPG